MIEKHDKIKKIIIDTLSQVKTLGVSIADHKQIILDGNYKFSSTMEYMHEYDYVYIFCLRFMSCGEMNWNKQMNELVVELSQLYNLYEKSCWATLEWLIKLRFAWICLEFGEDALNLVGIPEFLSKHIASREQFSNEMVLLRPAEHRWEDCLYNINNIQVESEEHEIREVWLNEKYYDELHPVKPGQVVFDIGAYKGESTLWYTSKTTRSGYVYACEMVPCNIDILNNNISRNELGASIEIVPFAIGTFEQGFYNDRLNRSGYVLEQMGAHPISTITLDEFVARKGITHIDWIKMDIEGGECNALESAKQSIVRYKPSLAIAAYHSLNDYKRIAETIMKIDSGYRLYLSHKIISPIETTIFAHHVES